MLNINLLFASGFVQQGVISANQAAIAYIIAGVLFIMALRGLSSPESSRRGNIYGMLGISISIITSLLYFNIVNGQGLFLVVTGLGIGGIIGAVIAKRIAMTSMPQLIAFFHSLVGLAAVLVACAAFFSPEAFGIGAIGNINAYSLLELSLGAAIGAITFTGSIIAFLKLNGNMSGAPISFKGQHFLNLGLGLAVVVLIAKLMGSGGTTSEVFLAIILITLLLGILLIIPIGGADMPVVISMLNSYSGWAAAALGFTLGNLALIITGALVGSSGAILSYIMCKGMNRSFINVILGGFGAENSDSNTDTGEQKPFKRGSAEDAAFIMKNASKVLIVPGYGLAVAQAQHATREMVDALKEGGVEVKYAIHPVAGRMPGHMNVLLAEANVPYDEVFELEDINSEFATADVAFVVGANDVTNPSAKTDSSSPIFGMPILDVENSSTVLFVKRSMSAGYAGVDNPLFYADNTMMLLSDAKKMVEEIIKAL